MNLFFDTSVLVKIFHKENGSEQVIAVTRQKDALIWVSEIAKVEYVSALHRRFRMKEIAEQQLQKLLTHFNQEWKHFYIEPLGKGILEEAESLLLKYGKTIGLRTLDALHLATFNLISEEEWTFVAADAALLKVAKQLNVPVLNPLEVSS